MTNELWILESLRDHERKTGTELRDFVIDRRTSARRRIEVELRAPLTRNDFLEDLERVFDSASAGNFPILHIEAHGGAESLFLASGEQITWDDLYAPLVRINKRLKGNLIITVAACEGGNMAKTVLSGLQAPFLVVVGPEKKIYDNELLNDYSEFYYEYVSSRSLTKARWALNAFKVADQTYYFSTVTHCFTELQKDAYLNPLSAGQIASRVAALVAQAVQSDPDCDVEDVRREAESIVLDRKLIFRRAWEKFVFVDEYAENRDIFPFPFESA